MWLTFRHLMKNKDGATAIEYALIASLIAVTAISAMWRVGDRVGDLLNTVASAFT